jgi:hypothetical protein
MNWWNEMTGSETYLDKRNTITGFVGPQENLETLNACLLLAKWHVYRCKLDESDIFFYNYLSDLKFNLDIEHTIAIRNDKLGKYNSKWQIVEDYIT